MSEYRLTIGPKNLFGKQRIELFHKPYNGGSWEVIFSTKARTKHKSSKLDGFPSALMIKGEKI